MLGTVTKLRWPEGESYQEGRMRGKLLGLGVWNVPKRKEGSLPWEILKNNVSFKISFIKFMM